MASPTRAPKQLVAGAAISTLLMATAAQAAVDPLCAQTQTAVTAAMHNELLLKEPPASPSDYMASMPGGDPVVQILSQRTVSSVVSSFFNFDMQTITDTLAKYLIGTIGKTVFGPKWNCGISNISAMFGVTKNLSTVGYCGLSASIYLPGISVAAPGVSTTPLANPTINSIGSLPAPTVIQPRPGSILGGGN